MVDLSMLLMSGAKYVDTSTKDIKSSTTRRRPRVPSLIKYTTWFVWTALVGYLLYQQENINYFFFMGRLIWFITLMVSLRDGKVNLSSVEYNIQTKSIVGIVSYSIGLYIVASKQIPWLIAKTSSLSSFTEVKSYYYYAMGIAAAYQSFENPFAIMYCRPSPFPYTKWTVIEDYISLPLLLSFMIMMENDKQLNYSDGGLYLSSSWYQLANVFVYVIITYKWVRSYLEYYRISSISTETMPLKHQFTATIDTKLASRKDATPSDTTYVWHIYGKSYDMNSYVSHHPGGVEAIMLGANREDCTTLFQSYHPFNIEKAKAILSKYEIVTEGPTTKSKKNSTNVAAIADHKDVEEEKKSDDIGLDMNQNVMSYGISNNHVNYNHENDLFYNVLCQRVEKKLLENGIDPIRDRIPTTQRYTYYFFLVVAIIASAIAHCQGSLFGSFLLGVFGWLMGAIGHDGGHYAVSHYPWVNDYAVWGMSFLCNPIMWQHQHTYAHHGYTNQFEHDPDLHHFDMFLRYHRKYQPHPIYKNQYSKLFVILAFTFTCFGQCYWIPIRFIQERSLYGTVNWSDRHRLLRSASFIFHFVIYSVLVMAVPFFVHKSTYIAAAASLLPIVTSGLLFAFCSQIGHITEMCMNSTDEESKMKRHPIARTSWAASQIESTNDFCPQSSLWHLVANGLTLQVEHHLFPGLNHCHLMLIQPIVEQACAEYNVNYKKYNTWNEVMDDMFAYLNKLTLE